MPLDETGREPEENSQETREPAVAAEQPIDLRDPSLYFNRELSLLRFQQRVLAQAKDASNPLLERLRFLCICSSNLDEFFEVRVSDLKRQLALSSPLTAADGRSPSEQLQRITEFTTELVEEGYRVLNESIVPAMRESGIFLLRRSEWTDEQTHWLKDYFHNELFPVLTPLGLDPAHPFPRVLNKSLNFIVSMEGKDAFGRNSGYAIVRVPRGLPRTIQLPKDIAQNENDFVFLSSIIHEHIGALFPGMAITGCYQFRLTRNSDLALNDEFEDLMHALKGELFSRRYGDSVRLEIDADCPQHMCELLLTEFKLKAGDMYRVHGPVNLSRLVAIYDRVDRQDLKFPLFTPSLPDSLSGKSNMFEAIKQQDILLHLPFDSFNPLVDLLRQASIDPDVAAIKITLYRSGSQSVIADILESAAKAGKEVTAVVELRARFDEETNIDLATRLQKAGAQVVYGVVGFKTHAKMMLIVRREKGSLRHYSHLGTGNYHTQTARFYTDFGLLTCDEKIGKDIQRLFLQLTGFGKALALERLLQSPFTLHSSLLERINREAEHARAGGQGRIIAKMNALIEPQIIEALYNASGAGVKIDLIIRGMCCLRPGIPGVSENIKVRSIVGRFLEHSRVFYFSNDGNEEVWLSSADWMGRNLFNRVEICFPVVDAKLKKRVIEEGLNTYLEDQRQAWLLTSDGEYERVPTSDDSAIPAQQHLLQTISSKY